MESLSASFHLVAAPTAVSWGPNRLDVFMAGESNTPWQRVWNGSVWIGPIRLPIGANIPAVGVGVVSLGPNRLDVFAAGAGNTPWWWHWNGNSWGDVPQPLASGANLPAVTVAATSSGPNLLDVFAAGAGNTPWWWHWNGSSWSAAQALPPVANLPAETIAAISPRPNRLDVFAPGAGNHLWHWWREGSPTWNVEDLGGNLPGEGVAVASWGPNRIDVFGASRGSGNALQHWWWDGTAFRGPQSLGGNLVAAAVSAVVPGPNQLDVFGISADRYLVRWRWDGMDWIGPSPRAKNLPAGDVSAVVTAPGRVHVFARGENNSLQHWPGGGLASSSSEPWTNFAGNQQVASPAGHCYPGSLEEVVAIVKEAEQRGRRVRAVGSSWSFSDVAVTPDYIVETSLLNSLVTEVLSANPSVLNSRGAALKLLHVEAGITIVDLNKLLDRRYLALGTMGGSSGQTLAGAVSTCVHGADIDRGPLPDIVRAIHLVGPGGIQYWIEPSDGITDKARLSAALGLDPANIRYDDDWFNSVLVSVGCMGIIYSFLIEVVDQYDLVEDCQHLSWEAVRTMLVNGTPFAAARSVQVALNPFKLNVNGTLTHQCYLSTRTEAEKTQAAPGGGDSLAQLWPALGGVITAAANLNPNLIETLTTNVLNNNLPQGRKQGFAHTIMASPDPPPARGLGLEIAFDATNNNYLSFVDEALQILETAYAVDKQALGGWFSMRFVGHSRAYLSPQHQFTRTCMVEIVGLEALHSTQPILDRIEIAGLRHGGIQHWGMFYHMLDSDVLKAFKDLDKWLGVRALLTNQGTIHTFDNAFAEQKGLTRLPGGGRSIDDFFNLAKAVNATTLGRIEGEIKDLRTLLDAANATTLGRMEGEIKDLRTLLDSVNAITLGRIEGEIKAIQTKV